MSSPLSGFIIYFEMKSLHRTVLLYPVKELRWPLLCPVSVGHLHHFVDARHASEFIQLYYCYLHTVVLFLYSVCISVFISERISWFSAHRTKSFLKHVFIFVFTQSLNSYNVTKTNREVIGISSFHVLVFACIIFICPATSTGGSPGV